MPSRSRWRAVRRTLRGLLLARGAAGGPIRARRMTRKILRRLRVVKSRAPDSTNTHYQVAVVDGAMLKCMFGASPGTLTVTNNQTVKAEGKAVATIMDFAPYTNNISSFGMCQSMMNPQVIAATAAAMGVLTPQQCTPATVVPWLPPAIPPVVVSNLPSFDDSAKCTCLWAPMGISISNAQTTKTEVP